MNPIDSKRSLEIATPDDCEVVITRMFDAPRRLVFECFTKPEYITRWLLGPAGWSMPVCKVDLRPGGALRYVWRNAAEGQEFGCSGTYREVAPPERIVHVETYDGDSGETLVTTRLFETGGSTTVTMTIRYPTRERRDAALEMGMADGLGKSYDRLEAVLIP